MRGLHTLVQSLFSRLFVLAASVLLMVGALAQAAEPIKIGFGVSLTGGLASSGKAHLLAMQIWAEEVNAKGGLLGRPVQIIYYDDQTNAANVPAIYAKLLDIDKVDLLVGHATESHRCSAANDHRAQKDGHDPLGLCLERQAQISALFPERPLRRRLRRDIEELLRGCQDDQARAEDGGVGWRRCRVFQQRPHGCPRQCPQIQSEDCLRPPVSALDARLCPDRACARRNQSRHCPRRLISDRTRSAWCERRPRSD